MKKIFGARIAFEHCNSNIEHCQSSWKVTRVKLFCEPKLNIESSMTKKKSSKSEFKSSKIIRDEGNTKVSQHCRRPNLCRQLNFNLTSKGRYREARYSAIPKAFFDLPGSWKCFIVFQVDKSNICLRFISKIFQVKVASNKKVFAASYLA